MPKCLDLSRLPKAPGLRSINRRNVTPGSPLPLLFPGTTFYKSARAVDPTHPATRRRARAFPHFSCPAFTLRAVPKGALLRPEFERHSSRAEKSKMVLQKERKDSSKKLDMSILFMISKKNTNKRAVVRNRIAMRLRSAFELIVTRGANAEPEDNIKGRQLGKECRLEESSSIVKKPEKKLDRSDRELKPTSLSSSITPSNLKLVSDPAPTKHLILQDWTYVMSPSLLSYSMPLPDLIQHLRTALERIRVQSMKLDAQWALVKKPTSNPLLPDSEEPVGDWRHVTADEDDIPVLSDLDEPQYGLIRPKKSIDQQQRPIKLFFPTSPSSEESSSALAGDDQLVTSPGSADTSIRIVSTANKPSHRSSVFIPVSSKPTLPSPSPFRMGAMERLATAMNRPLVVPGRKAEQRHS